MNQNDLLEALRVAMAPVPSGDGFTGPELAERLGVHSTTIRQHIRKWLADGVLVTVPLQRVRINGTSMTIIGYGWKP